MKIDLSEMTVAWCRRDRDEGQALILYRGRR